jgi:hypothetical protein
MRTSKSLRYYRAAWRRSARQDGRKLDYVESPAAIRGVLSWHECCFGFMVYHGRWYAASTGMVLAVLVPGIG